MPSMEFHGRNFCRYHVIIFENDRVREPDMETLQFVGSSASHFVDDISVKEDFLNFIEMHLVFDLTRTSGRSAPIVLVPVPHTQMLVTTPVLSHNP